MQISLRLATVLVLAAAAASAVAPPVAAQHVHAPGPASIDVGVDTMALRAHTRFLADDLLRGRQAGTDGERIAATYIASQLMRLGLEPAGPGASYFQPIPLYAARIEGGTALTIERGVEAGGGRDPGAARDAGATRGADAARDAGATTWHASPADFIVGAGGADAFRDFSGRLVFAGSALEAGPALSRLGDVSDVVVVLAGPLGAAATHLEPEWRRRGVTGIVVLAPEPDYYDLLVRSRGPERLFVDADVAEPVWQSALPTLVLGPALSREILAEAGRRHVAPAGDDTAGAAAIPIDWTIDARVAVTRRALQSANVAAVVPGSDPALRREVIVYTAHYDHLGLGEPDATGDSIYNGFSDNAAGVAMLLAIAERLSADPPARSVAFLFFAAEEKGLLGSSYFAAAPTIPLASIRAVINLDAGAPPAPPVSWRLAIGAGSEALEGIARRVAAERGWQVVTGPASPNSDHWPFAARGVPAVFLIPGADWEATSAETADQLRRRFEHYHLPSDRWRADFPFSGMARYAGFALAIGRAAASASHP
jgi:hypothetical protein